MKEVKFRAWLKGRMVYITPDDDYFIDGDGRLVKIEQIENGCSYQGFEDHECNLMQYTGLKDKDGREIYEGDVYGYTLTIDGNHCNEHHIQSSDVVKFEDGAFYHGEHLLSDVIEYDDTLIYLGNSYENPELLEESQNGTK